MQGNETNAVSPYLTIPEAVTHSRLSKRTLWKLLREKRLTRYKPAGVRRVLLLREELDQVIQSAG